MALDRKAGCVVTGDMDGLESTLERVWKLAWWALLLRGLIAIAFGIMALIWPTDSLVALVLVYGAYMLVDGVFSIVGAFSSDTSERWWLVASELCLSPRTFGNFATVSCRSSRPK